MLFLDRHIGKIVFFLLLIIFLIAWFGPFTVAYKLNYTGKVYPAKKWSLSQDNNQYITESRNFSKGVQASLQNYIFERGDIVEIEFNEDIENKDFVSQGSDLLEFHSYILEQEAADLQSQVGTQVASFNDENTGEKISIVEEAKKSLEIAKKNLDLQEKNFKRSAELFKDQVIPEAEYQFAETQLEVAKSSVGLAEQKLISADTGEKPESIGVINAQMNLINVRLSILDQKRSNYKVTAPFAGEVVRDPFSNDLISLIDTTDQVIIIPVEVQEKTFIDERIARAFLEIPELKEDQTIRIKLDKKVNIVDNRQVVLAIVQIPTKTKRLDEGLLVNCHIICDTISIRDYIKRKFF